MRNGLVEGVSLRAVLRVSEAMAPEAAASVLAGMLVTLAVVHGDVRPEHVQVDGSGELALTDFGSTGAKFVPNSPTYLAPERLKGAHASQAADVFSATAVFFECLTNEAPFVAATRDDLAALHEYTEIIAEFAPPDLRPLTQHGLAADPARRPATPHAFLDEVTATATELYGPDWEQRGRALLAGWAAAAAEAEGTELAAPFGRGAGAAAAESGASETAAADAGEAPPVGEPIDEALLGLDVEDAPVADDDGEEMPPPVGEPIEVDEAVLAEAPDDEPVLPVADELANDALPVEAAEHGDDEPADVVSPEEPAEAQGADYDWFTGGKPASETTGSASGAQADVLAAFDGARTVRATEPAADPYTPTGFDVFAGRSGGAASAAESEPVTGIWDEPETGDLMAGFDALDGERAAEAAGSETEEVAGATDSPDGDAGAEFGEQSAPLEADGPAEAADTGSLAAESESESEAGAEVDALADSPETVPDSETGADDEVADVFVEQSGEADPESDFADSEFEPLIEDSSELLAAFDAFSAPTADTAETLPTPDPFAGLGLETLAASSLLKPAAESQAEDSASAEPETESVEAEAGSGATPEADAVEPEADSAAEAEVDTAAEPKAEADAAEPEAGPEAEADSEAEPEGDPEPEPEPEPGTDSPADFEDDWIFPTKPSPKVPRSLSAFAVSLPSLPRPKAEDEEPTAPVQTSAPDDWFRPGVAEPAGADAHHTQVLNPDRDNTVESEATRTFDEVPAEVAGAGAEAVEAGSRGDDDSGGDDGRLDDAEALEAAPGGGPGGPRRKTLIGAVTTAVLLVAGATAVVLAGSGGNSPQGTGATPSDSSSSSAPSPTDMPTTPTGTSTGSGSDSSSTSSTPSYHHSSTHSRSHSSSSSPSSHGSSDTSTHSSSSSSPSDHTSSSTAPTSSSPTSPSATCTPGLLGFCQSPSSNPTTPGN